MGPNKLIMVFHLKCFFFFLLIKLLFAFMVILLRGLKILKK